MKYIRRGNYYGANSDLDQSLNFVASEAFA